MVFFFSDEDDIPAGQDGPGPLADLNMYICLATVKWAVLAWKMRPCDDQLQLWTLDEASHMEWKFVYDLRGLLAAHITPQLDQENALLQVKLGPLKPVVETVLEFHVTQLSLQELSLLAQLGFRMTSEQITKLTKFQLVETLALKVGDESFAKRVLASLPKPGNHEDDDKADDDMVMSMLLEAIGEDVTEFAEMKKEIKTREHQAKSRQWQRWKQEAEDATGSKILLLFAMLILFAMFRFNSQSVFTKEVSALLSHGLPI